MTTDPIDRDPLVRRLGEARFPPMSRELVPAALARARSDRPHRGWPRPRLAGAAAALLAIALAVTALAWAPARMALAQVPGLGGVGSLLGSASTTPHTLATATAGGYTVQVTDAYDDGTTVALTFAVIRDGGTPVAEDWWPFPYPTVTDSAGHALPSRFVPVRQAQTGSTVVYARALDGPAAGSPLNVDVTSLDDHGRLVPGHWPMHLSIAPSHSVRSLALPAGGKVGAATIAFQAVRVNDAYLMVQFSIAGIVDPAHPAPAAKGEGVAPTLYGPHGEKLAILSGGGGPTQQWMYQLADAPGTYHLVMYGPGGQRFTVPIGVPTARSGGVPKIIQP